MAGMLEVRQSPRSIGFGMVVCTGDPVVEVMVVRLLLFRAVSKGFVGTIAMVSCMDRGVMVSCLIYTNSRDDYCNHMPLEADAYCTL